MEKSAEIICVGTELLLGNILNGNAQFLAQELAHLGIPHYYQTVVGDNPVRLQRAIAIACDRARLILFTGGLGPTPDDLTTETIANFFDTPLEQRDEIVADITKKYAQRGRTLTANNLKQALLPQGAHILTNPIGTAPGLIWQPRSGLTLLTFPGVPMEMRRMWRDVAVPYLKQAEWVDSTLFSRTLKFWGVTESGLATQVSSFFDQTNPTVAPYANYGEVKLRITAAATTATEAEALIGPTERALRGIGGLNCFGADKDSLASVVGDLLRQRGETLAVAESCTGGGLGHLLTSVPGSSDYFWGGVIAYDNRVKLGLLGVNPDTLSQQGAVSPETAQQMAMGVRSCLHTTWGLSITGIAGPGGGTGEKPVGLVYIGLAGPDQFVTHFQCQWGSQRERDWLRRISACEALDQLRRHLYMMS
jgi:nicotinamide-nucleotide amidase